MKKTVLHIILLITYACISSAYGQSDPLEIYNSGGNKIENGSLLFVTNGPNGKVINTDTLYVKNICGSVLNLKIRKIENVIAAGTFNKFEALAQFLLPNETITPNAWELESGASLPSSAYFTASYYPQTIISTSSIIYSFLSVDESNQAIDSVFIVYVFSNTSVTPFDIDGKALYHREVLLNCDPASTHEYVVKLHNHSLSDVCYRVGKTIIDLEQGHELSFNFGGVEYDINENSSSGEGELVESEEILEGDNGFLAKFNPNGIDGNTVLTKVEYKFFNKLDGRDAEFVTLIYNPSGVGFSKTSTIFLSDAYPNPSSSIIIIGYNLPPFQLAKLKVYHVNGSLLKQYPVSDTENSIMISVESYTPGAYYYLIEVDGKHHAVKKFIVD